MPSLDSAPRESLSDVSSPPLASHDCLDICCSVFMLVSQVFMLSELNISMHESLKTVSDWTPPHTALVNLRPVARRDVSAGQAADQMQNIISAGSQITDQTLLLGSSCAHLIVSCRLAKRPQTFLEIYLWLLCHI